MAYPPHASSPAPLPRFVGGESEQGRGQLLVGGKEKLHAVTVGRGFAAQPLWKELSCSRAFGKRRDFRQWTVTAKTAFIAARSAGRRPGSDILTGWTAANTGKRNVWRRQVARRTRLPTNCGKGWVSGKGAANARNPAAMRFAMLPFAPQNFASRLDRTRKTRYNSGITSSFRRRAACRDAAEIRGKPVRIRRSPAAVIRFWILDFGFWIGNTFS